VGDVVLDRVDPPALIRVGVPVPVVGVLGVPPVLVLVGGAIGGGPETGDGRGAAAEVLVVDVRGVAAADVVPGDVEIEALFAEHHLRELLAHFVGVAAGRVGEPDEARAPAFELLVLVRGVERDGDGAGLGLLGTGRVGGEQRDPRGGDQSGEAEGAGDGQRPPASASGS
jgi:hypothetical protein